MSVDTKKTKRNIKPFDGEKYSIWKYRIRALLAEEDALKVLDSDRPDCPGKEWMRCERIATGIIIEYLTDSMLCFTTETDSAKEIIKKLDAIYERKSLATQLAIEKKLLCFKFKENTPLSKHLILFDEMVVELQAAGEALTEMSKIARLLLTLPSSYDPLITAIQTQSDDNLSLAFVKIKLLDYEVKLRSENSETSAKVLHVETKRDNERVKKDKKFKAFFKRKENYQPNRSFKNKAFNKKYYRTCEHCGRRNHEKKDCYYYRRSSRAEERQRTIQTVQVQGEGGSFAFMTGVHVENNEVPNHSAVINFILDSGATDHLVNEMDIFATLLTLEKPIQVSVAKKGEVITATKIGSINVMTNLGFTGVLEKVLYVPEVPNNLLSVRRIQEAGMSVIFSGTGGVTVKRGGKTILTGKSIQNLICVTFTIDRNMCNKTYANNIVIPNAYKLWHERLGHIESSKFVKMKQNDLIDGKELIDTINPTQDLCEACIYGKQARRPFSKERDRSHVTRPLFTVHSDVCGPIKPKTIDNKNYFVTFIDEFTHYTVVYLITFKSEVFKVFQDFVAKSESHFNLKIAYLNCDNGTEYLSNEFKAFCAQKGIQYHLTVPYTPQQNPIAERMNRTLLEKARAMIHGADLNKELWGEAILTAAHLINITPTKAIAKDTTPFELWHGKKPKLNRLKIFGSTVYVHEKNRQSKFDKKSFKGIFIGYEKNGYRILNANTGKFIIARDVIFDEINFKNSRPSVRTNSFEEESIVAIKSQKADEQKEISESQRSEIIVSDERNHENTNAQIGSDESDLRRSARIKNKPHINYNEEHDYHAYALATICEVPKSYSEIKNRDDKIQWEKAIKDEIDSLIHNNTWDIVPRPNNKNIVDCKWVFNIKMDEKGNPCKYKARLVARGFSQQYLLDYNETFAPVARITTFRMLVAFANQHNLLIHQMDVKTAFLNGLLKEEIYMRVPEGIPAQESQVCKLNKALYGLKQSARCWFELFEMTLKNHGFQNSSVDRCLYFLDRNHICKNVYVILYVDDLLIVTYDRNTLKSFKNYLNNKFSMTDMNEMRLFLGINVERKDDIITLDQSIYLQNVLNKYKMSECNSVSTPLPTKLDYIALNSDEYLDAPCRNLIGCLMYAMLCTRPDLCFAVNLLSRYQNKNNKELWQALKRVLRYVRGSLKYRLTYKRNDYKNILTGYVDSDWAGNEIDRKSTTGYIFKMFQINTICWNTKKQNSVATSSTEAEYMALYEAVKEACWLKSLLSSIKIDITGPITIFEDNNGCIAIGNNPTDHKRSKHIDVKYHFSRQKIEQKEIILKYIPTGEQLGDSFTKSVPAAKFIQMRKEIGLEEHQ